MIKIIFSPCQIIVTEQMVLFKRRFHYTYNHGICDITVKGVTHIFVYSQNSCLRYRKPTMTKILIITETSKKLS